MRAFIGLLFVLAGCSTVQSLRDDPPLVERVTSKSLTDVQSCISDRTANQQVQFLPRANGASLSAGVTTGASRFVTWVVDIADLGAERRVSLHSTSPNSKLVLPALNACL